MPCTSFSTKTAIIRFTLDFFSVYNWCS